jgi:hypothetical protein
MHDSFGGKVDVRPDRESGPYIMIDGAELDRVERLLRENGISFMLEDAEKHAAHGTPEAAVIEFGKGADVRKIQRVLDSVQ